VASFQVEVRVSPRADLLDPQGKAVEQALKRLGFAGASSVRVGKLITLTLEAPSREEAHRLVEEMCAKLLANPVTEDYSFEVAPLPAPAAREG